MNHTIALEDGVIYSSGMVMHANHHCNLSCRGCAQLAPMFRSWQLDPSVACEDLSVLAKYYRAEWLSISGGEPLLHPHLVEVIEAIRRSGICKYIRIGTNGILLPAADDDLWRSVDVIRVSQYPGREMSAEQMEWCQQQAQKHGVDLAVVHTPFFTHSYADMGSEDQALVQSIYDTCIISFHCNCVENGYFFKCPRSIVFPEAMSISPTADAIRIVDSPTFGQELVSFLTSPTPLLSCRRCLGNVGEPYPHEQMQRGEWKHLQQHSTEEMINWKLLNLLKRSLAKSGSFGANGSDSQPSLAQDLANWAANRTAVEKAVQIASRMAKAVIQSD